MIRVIVVSLSVAALLAFSLEASAQTKKTVDVIYLKSGAVVKGTVLETIPAKSVRIQTLDGKMKTYKMSAVKKVAKETITVQEKPDAAQVKEGTENMAPEKSVMVAPPPQPVEQDLTRSQDDRPSVPGEKSPTLAFALSFLCPGGGQYYNGDIWKGIIQTGVAAGGIALALTAGYEEEFVKDPYYYASYGYWREYQTDLFYVGLGIAGAAWLWSVIDAPISAGSINDEYARTRYGHTLEMTGSGYVVGVDPHATRRGVGAKIVVHF